MFKVIEAAILCFWADQSLNFIHLAAMTSLSVVVHPCQTDPSLFIPAVLLSC